MSLSTLPGELFDLIASEVRNVDYYCLRITCRSFKGRLGEKYHPVDFFDRFALGYREHNEFLMRLFRPGNIYHNSSFILCGTCSRLRPPDKFPVEGLSINDHQVCRYCVGHFVLYGLGRGQKHISGGQAKYTCARCRARGYDVDANGDHGNIFMHQTVNTPGRPRLWRLCYRCHMDGCEDPNCPGWPEAFKKRHYAHFYGPYPVVLAPEVGYRCSCNWCRDGLSRNRNRAFIPALGDDSIEYGDGVYDLYIYDEWDEKFDTGVPSEAIAAEGTGEENWVQTNE